MGRCRQKKQYNWSKEIAYSVGLIASDGCLSKDGRHIDLTSVDVEQLRNFLDAIGRSGGIALKRWKGYKNHWQKAYRVQFSDVAYYDFLLQAGLTPSKSKIMGSLNIPDQFYGHFIRGVFDGDGSCYAYFDKRWKASYMFYIQFTSASIQFVKYIQLTNQRLFAVSPGSVHPSKGAYILSYAKHDSVILHKMMYANSDGLYLPRKFNKLNAFIEQEKSVIVVRNARVAKLVYALD